MARKIELTPVEQTLRQLLLDVAAFTESQNVKRLASGAEKELQGPQHEPLVLRFTGGWVRDKLLGVPSHDIDVAINKMTGEQFGGQMEQYLKLPDQAQKYGIDAEAVAKGLGLHKIAANPEKSKHLETVATKILGIEIDLVNLRKETYTDDSRNPQMEFGTPEEDALRRDATVNAMFYNLSSDEVEDLTGKGHDDMRNKRIRTPLEPFQTFKDDPLRILRLIRFATRLGYTIDEDVTAAMGDDAIKEALRVKISRERVGVELEKTLKGNDPRRALAYIDDLGLYEVLFVDPTSKVEPEEPPQTQAWKAVYNFLGRLHASRSAQVSNDSIIIQTLFPSPEHWYQGWISASLVPWHDVSNQAPAKPTKRAIPWVTMVAKEGIKAPNKIADIIDQSVQNQKEIIDLKDRSNEQAKFPSKRKQGLDATARDVLGMALRRWGNAWRQQVLFALLSQILDRPDESDRLVEGYAVWLRRLQSENLLEAPAIKPLINGNLLAKALETPPGPWMKEALDVVVAWQLRNPESTNREEIIEAVKQHLSLSGSDWKRRNNSANSAVANGAKDADADKDKLNSAMIAHILENIVRPQFSRTERNASVSAAGREQNVNQKQSSLLPSEEEASKPWKRNMYVLPLLRWAVGTLSSGQVEANWPLLIPPILALVDDIDVYYKVEGCGLLRSLLSVTQPSLLRRTGLAGVFDEALMPCLSYLPTLTPVDDSVRLLGAAYPALIVLIEVQYSATSYEDTPVEWLAKVKAYDKLIRKGVLRGMEFAGQHVRVAEVLVRQLVMLVEKEGVDSVKHLQQTVPLLTGVLCEPFALAYPPLVLAALDAARTVITSGQQRIDRWKVDLLRGLCVLWTRLETEGTGGAEHSDIRQSIKDLVQLLDETLRSTGPKDDGEGEEGLHSTASILLGANERLEELFQHIVHA